MHARVFGRVEFALGHRLLELKRFLLGREHGFLVLIFEGPRMSAFLEFCQEASIVLGDRVTLVLPHDLVSLH
jgi:hypothetical protein